jgi:hypothetical protein
VNNSDMLQEGKAITLAKQTTVNSFNHQIQVYSYSIEANKKISIHVLFGNAACQMLI